MKRIGILVSWAVLAAACATTSKDAAKAAPAPAPAAAAAAAAPAPAPADPMLDASFDQGPGGAAPRALLVLGMTRPIGAQAAIFSAKQLNNYLSRQLGGEVVTKLYDDSTALGDALSAGVIDAAWLTPTAYVRASERAAIKPIARLSRGGYTSYRSVIFTKTGSKLLKLDDLKGKKMIWVAPGSASGRAFPRAHLKKIGKDPDRLFAAQNDAPDHREVCLAVLDGRADAGASLSDERPSGEKPIVDGCREAGLDPALFTILERTAPIPNDVIAVRADLPEVVESRVRDALLQMAGSDEGQQQLKEIFRADGFGGVTDADFAPVREVQMLLELK